MRRLAVLGLLLLAVSPPARADDAPAVSLSDGRTGQIRFESVTPSGYFALARRDGLPKAVVVGTLRLPPGEAERVPAMVVAHGSAGVDEREQAWAERLIKAGIAAFVVDSFTPAQHPADRDRSESALDRGQRGRRRAPEDMTAFLQKAFAR